MAKPIVAMDFNVAGFASYNLALRLRHAGYTNVYWLRGSRGVGGSRQARGGGAANRLVTALTCRDGRVCPPASSGVLRAGAGPRGGPGRSPASTTEAGSGTRLNSVAPPFSTPIASVGSLGVGSGVVTRSPGNVVSIT